MILNNLNPQQIIAVKSTGNVLITACPGSGKTRVLTHKIAYELERLKESKKKILALTFTNRAADEITRRIRNFELESNRLWSGTIHSFCLDWILKLYSGYCEPIKNGYSIIDEPESNELLNELKSKHNVRTRNFKHTYNLDGSYDVYDVNHIPVIKEYKQILRLNKQIDFDDILYFAYETLLRFPIIAKRLSNVFDFIFVDEYQDTQELQYAILAEIVKANRNKTKVFFVGDVCQAIYGSLGGVAKEIGQIAKEFGGIEINSLELSGNYRSNQRIIDYYSHFQIQAISIQAISDIANNSGLIILNTQIHKNEVHDHIASIIRERLDGGDNPNDICIMAPQWWMVIPMGRRLKTLLPDVDFDAYGLNPLKRIRENIWYKFTYLLLTVPANTNVIFRYQWAQELIDLLDIVIPDFLIAIENRQKFVLRIIRSFYSLETNSLIFIVTAINHFLNSLNIEISNYKFLNEQLEAFSNFSRARFGEADFEFANDIHVLRRIFNTNNGVVISTCHGVKGEEYNTVVAFGLRDGFIPNWGDPDLLASKKLLYVICSRAKNNLYLISEVGHSNNRVVTPDLANVVFDYNN